MKYDYFGNFIIFLKDRGMLDDNFTIMEISDDLGAWGYGTSGTMMWDEKGKAWKIDDNPCMEFGTTELVYDEENIEHRLIKPLRKHRAKEYDFKTN